MKRRIENKIRKSYCPGCSGIDHATENRLQSSRRRRIESIIRSKRRKDPLYARLAADRQHSMFLQMMAYAEMDAELTRRLFGSGEGPFADLIPADILWSHPFKIQGNGS